MYRAYYGQGDPTNIKPNSKGIFTNAVSNFIRMLNHLLKEDYDKILVAFDAGKHTFRHDIQKDYKAGRASMPDEFRMQIAYIKDYLKRANINQYEIPLYEADDIVGTMAEQGKKEGFHVDIYSSDKDLLQLIDDEVTVHLTKRGMSELEDFTPSHFEEVYSLKPSQFIDLKAMMGDKSDNISGVPGIGEVKGIKYLQQFNDINNLLENVNDIKGKDKDKFIENKDLLLQCKTMVTILRDAPLHINLSYLDKKEPDYDKLIELYEFLELNSLLKEIRKEKKDDYVSFDYKVIDNPIDIKSILLPNSSLIFETFDYNYHKSDVLAIGLRNKLGTFIIKKELLEESIDFKMYLNDSDNQKSIYDYKKSYVLCKKHNLNLSGIDFDMLLAAYVINPSFTKNEFKNVAAAFEYYDVSYDEEIYSKGVKKTMPEENILFSHISKKVNCLYLIKNKIKEIVSSNGQDDLLYNIEIPLARVLGDMEFEGITVDRNELNIQREELSKGISEYENKIYELAGEKFNIQSPKQLGVILLRN